jgi:hypothetical protein
LLAAVRVMPTRTYMVIDERGDYSIRIPRLELSPVRSQ